MTFGLALSGLQEFVFDLVTADPKDRNKNAARRLRLRSAILNLVPALAAYRLKEQDPQLRIFYLGGGKVLAEVSEDAIHEVTPFLHELYDWLVRSSAGTLCMYWVSHSGQGTDREKIKGILRELANVKWQAGRDRRSGAWFGQSTISALANEGLGDEKWESDQGSTLARRKNLQGFSVGNGIWPIASLELALADTNPTIPLVGTSESNLAVAIPTYVPRKGDSDDVAELKLLAEEGKGAPYLALLKMDGDSIGALMQKALDAPNEAAYFETSKKLSTFFGQTVPQLLEKKFGRLYLVYSGGDDLVATGHFDTVLRAAQEIAKQYQTLGLGGISAGVSFYHRSAPILRAVESAEEELENAKEVRNAISIGGFRLSWKEFELALQETVGLTAAIESGAINRGALAMIRQLSSPFRGESHFRSIDQDTYSEASKVDPIEVALHATRLHSIPQFHYMRNRRQGWRENDWDPAVRQLFDSLETREDDWPRAALSATLASWLTKKTEETR